jgi:hypothetical protein
MVGVTHRLDTRTITKDKRRYIAYVGPFNTNQIHERNPWVAAWWSAAFPGLGHLLLGSYLKGFILFIWELVINVYSKLNVAILYTFHGDFEKAKVILEKRWLLLYCAVYICSIWDSYRTTVDINKLYILAKRERAPVVPFALNEFALNYLDKRNPWLALIWSVLMPGLGSLYAMRVPEGFFLLIWAIVTVYFSHFLEAVHYTFYGKFSQAISVLDPEWYLFMPSIYGFALYEAYVLCVEYNKLFKKEQSQFLKRQYQYLQFKMPTVK